MYLFSICFNPVGKTTRNIFCYESWGGFCVATCFYSLRHQCCAIETNINKCSFSLFSPILSQSARLVTGSISCEAFHSLACWWISPFYHYLSPSIRIRIKLFSFRHFPVTMRFLLLAASIGVAFSYPNGSFHILWVTTLMTKTDYREKN